jgi:predicted nucleotidyltransferase
MRRATITIPDDLEADLEAYVADQKVPPSLAAITQTALRQFLRGRPPGDGPVDEVLRHRSEIRAIAAARGANDIYLFGSAARGESGQSSDLDFAVEVRDGTTLFDLARMRSDLVELLQTDVDVVPLKGLEGSMRARFDEEAIKL